MSISGSLSECPKAKCHLIPCNFKKSCSAQVDKYFEPTISKKEKPTDVLTSSFRGRPLVGRQIDLPKNSVGIVLNSSKKNSSKLTVEKKFDSFTYWNWDQNPTESDLVPRSLQWLAIAGAAHQQLKASDLN